MTIQLKEIAIPEFGVPNIRPAVPAATYEARVRTLTERAGADWVVVYADREHLANIAFLTGFEPRFEEALLLLGKGGERIIITGNESVEYTPIAILPGIKTVLAQSLSLMGQPRSEHPDLVKVLADCGIAAGQSVALAGWKYLESTEWDGAAPTFFVPAFIVDALRRVIGQGARLTDATPILMNPVDGQRAIVDADEIASLEWGAARASAAVWRIVVGARAGQSEFECAANMGYAGEVINCHVMMSGGDSTRPVIGLSSPSARILKEGDGVTTAVGYWGGLSCRAGLLGDPNERFLAKAKTYFDALRTWYETVDIGVAGKVVHAAVNAALAPAGFRSALNPGHLTSYDEWMHSPIRPGSDDVIKSGMPFQVDIIPVPQATGDALNCEDTVVIADAELRAELKARHPEVYARIEARRAFIRDSIGIELKPCILPLSSQPLCLPPFWNQPSQLLVVA